MSLRRPRSHIVGISNIDFRTKKDEENLRIFEPWTIPKDFGTMGYKNYKKSPKIQREIFTATKRINTHRDIVNDYPDPRFYATARFYQDNHINLKIKSIINTERVSNLEETFKGKDVFIGDGMGITDTIRQRKRKKDYKPKTYIELNSVEERKQQIEKTEKLAKEKNQMNKDVCIETQITKINAVNTENNLLNTKKVKEIRQAIRKRYGNRKKANKIFQQWARTFPDKITVYDAYKMINALNIPINYNETKALIASASTMGNEFLNYEDFSNLIFNKYENLYENPLRPKTEEKYLLQEDEGNNLRKKIYENNKEINDYSNVEILKNFISQRPLAFIKNLKEISREKYFFSFIENNKDKNINFAYNKCNYDKFLRTILSLNPSELFAKEKYIKTLFDEYKDKDNFIDIKSFINNLYEKNCNEHMSKLKDEISNVFKTKIDKKRKIFEEFLSENKDKKTLINQKKYDLDKQILFKKEIELKNKKELNDERLRTEINSTVPSTPWINHVFDKRTEHYNFLNRVEHALSARPTMKYKYLKTEPKTRFGASPKWKNTAEIMIGDELSPTYINEKDRFVIDRDIGKEDKKKKEKMKMERQNRIKTAIQKIKENHNINEFLRERKEKYSMLEKCQVRYNYEELYKKRNFLVE